MAEEQGRKKGELPQRTIALYDETFTCPKQLSQDLHVRAVQAYRTVCQGEVVSLQVLVYILLNPDL